MISALDPGALVAFATPDPSQVVGIDTDGDNTVTKAMAYENSASFNIYKEAHFKFPGVVKDDPYYMKFGDDARLEISHLFGMIAMTQFPPLAAETERTIGWLTYTYDVGLFNYVLPDFTSTAANKDVDLTSATAATFFNATSGANDPIQLVPATWLSSLSSMTIGLLKILVMDQWSDFAAADVFGRVTNVLDFPIKRGKWLYAYATGQSDPEMYLYTNITDALDESNPVTYASAISLSGTFTGGYCKVEWVPMSLL